MAGDNEINVKITATDDGFQSSIEQAKSTVQELPGAMQEAAEASRSFGENLRNLGEIALGVFGGLELSSVVEKAGDAMKEAVFGTAEWAEQLENLSLSLGASVKELQLVQGAAQLSGVDINRLANFVQQLNRRFAEASSGGGSKAFAAALKDLALTPTDFSDPVIGLEKLSAAINRIGPDTQRAREDLAELGGRAGTFLLPLVTQFNENAQAARDLGYVLGDEDVAKAGQFQRSLNVLWGELKADSRQFGADIAPIGTAIDELAINTINTMSALVKTIFNSLDLALDNMARGVIFAGTAVYDVVTGQWSKIPQAWRDVGANIAADDKLIIDRIKSDWDAATTATAAAVKKINTEPVTSKGGGANAPAGGAAAAGNSSKLAAEHQKDLNEQFRMFEAEQNLEVSKAGEAVGAKIAAYQQELDWLTTHHETNTVQYIDLETRKVNEVARMNEEQQRQLQKMWEESAAIEKKALEQADKDAKKAAEDARKAAQQVGAAWDNTLATISGGFDQIFNGVLQGTQTTTQAFRKMGEDIALSLAKSGIKDLLLGAPKDSLVKGVFGTQGQGGGIAGLIASFFGGPQASGMFSSLGGQGQSGGQGGAQGQGQGGGGPFAALRPVFQQALQSMLPDARQWVTQVTQVFGGIVPAFTGIATAIKAAFSAISNTSGLSSAFSSLKQLLHSQVLADASASAAKAYHSAMVTIPPPANLVVAPVAAGATFAGVMAYNLFERGGIVPPTAAMVSGGIPALLHPNEMVLPRNISETMQGLAARGGGDSGGHHFHFNFPVHAVDAADAEDFFMRNQGALVRSMKSAMRGALVEAPSH